jgi:hypothetical protein
VKCSAVPHAERSRVNAGCSSASSSSFVDDGSTFGTLFGADSIASSMQETESASTPLHRSTCVTPRSSTQGGASTVAHSRHEGGRLKHGVGFSVTAPLDASQDPAVSPHTVVVVQPRSGRRVSRCVSCSSACQRRGCAAIPIAYHNCGASHSPCLGVASTCMHANL